MPSQYVGGSRLKRVLKTLPQETTKGVRDALDAGIKAVQKTAVALVPVRTGNLRKAISGPNAIGRRDKGLWVEFGFRTKAIQEKAKYAHFVEFGTKGYQAGDVRAAGVDRHGRMRFKKMRRFVPPRPAKPFMRPALDLQMPMIRRRVSAEVRKAIERAARG